MKGCVVDLPTPTDVDCGRMSRMSFKSPSFLNDRVSGSTLKNCPTCHIDNRRYTSDFCQFMVKTTGFQGKPNPI